MLFVECWFSNYQGYIFLMFDKEKVVQKVNKCYEYEMDNSYNSKWL